MAYATRSGGAGKRGAPAPARGPRCAVTSAASPGLFLSVLARLGENGCAAEVARCVRLCRDTYANVQLWERVVDLPHAVYCTTRLIHWAEAGDPVRVLATLGRGANVNARDPEGYTALDWASDLGHRAVVLELLNHGAVVDACDSEGRTALMWASSKGRTDVMLELAARGADINARPASDDGATPLMFACSHGQAATAAALLRMGADVNTQDNCGWSALMWAANNGHIDAVRVLLAAPGVDVDLGDATGETTALSRVRDYVPGPGHPTVAALLVAAGAH